MSKASPAKSSSSLVHLVQPLPPRIPAADRSFERASVSRDLEYARLDNRRLKELLYLKDHELDFLADELEEVITEREPMTYRRALRFVSRLRGIAHKFESE